MDTPSGSIAPAAEYFPAPSDGAILAELERLHQPRRNWRKALQIFAITLLLSSALGWWRFGDPSFLAMLVAVLLFHEAGHFVAMRLFGYRDVRMFFIPFFGAAVSGRSFCIAGWKKALVSLMGPLPGIVLGTVILAVGIGAEHHSAWTAVLLTLLLCLNLSNLLPLQPFDGGQFLNALFFSRHRMFEAGFRVFACAVLGWLAWELNSVVLGVVAFLVLLAVRGAYQTATLAARLRGSLPEPEADAIPPEAARTILAALPDEEQNGGSSPLPRWRVESGAFTRPPITGRPAMWFVRRCFFSTSFFSCSPSSPWPRT